MPSEKLHLLLKHTLNIQLLENYLRYHYDNTIGSGWDKEGFVLLEELKEDSCNLDDNDGVSELCQKIIQVHSSVQSYLAIQKYLPIINNLRQLWINKNLINNTQDRKIKIDLQKIISPLRTDSYTHLIESYKDLFRYTYADITMPNNDQVEIIANTLLTVEDAVAKLAIKSEDEITEAVNKAYNNIKNSLPPKCVCPNYPSGKMRVLLILLEMLGEFDQKTKLKDNLITILRIENLFKLKFPKNSQKHFKSKSQYLSKMDELIKVIDGFDTNPKKQYKSTTDEF